MKPIKTISEVPGLSAPNGHYSYAVVYGGLVHVSGQLGRAAGMADDVAGDVELQTRRALGAIAAILAEAGSDLSRVLKVTLYVSDIVHWPRVNRIYEEILGAHRPARAVVPTGPLHFNALVEIEAVAATG